MRKLTIEYIRAMFPDDLISEKYKGGEEKLLWLCLFNSKHGCYRQKLHKHLFGQRCPKCWAERRGKSKRLRIQDIEKQFPELVPGQMYVNNRKKLLWRCLKDASHGTYFQTHNSHQQRHGCSLCGRDKTLKATRLGIEYLEKKFPLELVKGQKYVNAFRKLRWKCSAHGEYLQIYNIRQQGGGCPYCFESRGEKRIDLYLKNVYFVFEREKRFKTCRWKNPLPFDFCIPSLKVLIEYQGEQHYRWISFFNSRKSFKSLCRNDHIKRLWARRNGWRLIRIPYTIKNIEAYLDKKLLLVKAV
jgi:very-short-patch-repair endonuclease